MNGMRSFTVKGEFVHRLICPFVKIRGDVHIELAHRLCDTEYDILALRIDEIPKRAVLVADIGPARLCEYLFPEKDLTLARERWRVQFLYGDGFRERFVIRAHREGSGIHRRRLPHHDANDDWLEDLGDLLNAVT